MKPTANSVLADIILAVMVVSAGIFTTALAFGFTAIFVLAVALFFAAAIAFYNFGSGQQSVANATKLNAAESRTSSVCATALQDSTLAPKVS